MEGTLQNQRGEYQWMRIGFAPARWAGVVKLAAAFSLILLGIWLYLEIPATRWRWPTLLGVYLVAAIVYLNLGVWLHEQLHGLGFSGRPARRAHITYERKHLLILGGYFRVEGSLSYKAAGSTLLGPLWLSIGLLVVGCLGSFVLPGWWLPLVLSLVAASLLDMIHDLYMYSHIRAIGEKGKYWDRGHVMEAVWKG